MERGRYWEWLVGGVLVGLVGGWFYAIRHPGSRDLYDLAYGFGAYIRELATHGAYRAVFENHPTYGPIEFRTSRMPLIPVLGAFASLFGREAVWLYLIKNAVALALLAWALAAARESSAFRARYAVPLVVFLLVPTHAAVLFAVDFEEGYVVPLLCAALLLATLPADRMTRGRVVGLASLLAAMVLLKSSLLLVAGVLALVALLRPRAAGVSRAAPMIGLVAASLAWGWFGYQATGRWAIGGDASSGNGPNFYKANNPHTLDYYPLRHLDLLDERGLTKIQPSYKDEWDLHDTTMRQGWEFRRDHPEAVAEMNRRKAHAMFFRTTPAYFMEPVPERLGQDYRLWVARLAQWLGLAVVVWGLLPRRSAMARRVALATLGVYAAYLVPYVLGFVYERHLTPLIATSLFAAMLIWSNPND